jgi:hypothetical protein
LLLTLLAAFLGCGGPSPVVPGPSAPLTVRWRVDRVTRSRRGGDIDDGPLLVSFRVEGAFTATVPAGRGLGTCTTDRSFQDAMYCPASVSGTLVSRLVCGADPHTDHVVCFDAVRVGDRVEVSRTVYDVPEVDVTDGGEGLPKTLVERKNAGSVRLPAGEVRQSRTEHRDVSE